MSRAYCLTCNEKVQETPSGTCPLGHPVAAEDRGPEPWVGFAGDTDTEVAAVQMQHLDAAGRPREHATVGHHTNGQHHVNGSANGHASTLASHGTTPSTNGTHHASPPESPPPSSVDDDLTALLADALRDNAPEEAAPSHEPPLDRESADTAEDDTDWGELASLAAQLHLDEDAATDDGPAAPPAVLSPALPDELPEARPDELSAANIDDLLAELTGDAPATAAETAPPALPGDPAPFETAVQDLAPPPPPAPAPPAADTAIWDEPAAMSPPPPPPAPPAEDTSIWDEPAAPEDVPSAPAADPADIWAEHDEVPTVDAPPATTVDLYNFTARGTRVGESGAARPARKKRGRKR